MSDAKTQLDQLATYVEKIRASFEKHTGIRVNMLLLTRQQTYFEYDEPAEPEAPPVEETQLTEPTPVTIEAITTMPVFTNETVGDKPHKPKRAKA